MEAPGTRPLDGARGMLKDSRVQVKLSLLSAREFFRDPLETARSQQPGAGINRFAAGPGRYVLVRDPEAIWRVLVTDGSSFQQGKWKRRSRRYVGDSLNTLDGAEHRARRRVIQPSTARGRVDSFAPLIVARADRMQSAWRDGARIVLRDELDPLCLCVAGDVLLSTDLAPRAAELAPELVRVVGGLARLTPPVRGTGQRACSDLRERRDRRAHRSAPRSRRAGRGPARSIDDRRAARERGPGRCAGLSARGGRRAHRRARVGLEAPGRESVRRTATLRRSRRGAEWPAAARGGPRAHAVPRRGDPGDAPAEPARPPRRSLSVGGCPDRRGNRCGPERT